MPETITEQTRQRMRDASARRWAKYYNPHPCKACGAILKKLRLTYCDWSCNLADLKGRNTWSAGRKLPQEHRIAISRALMGNKYRLGIPHSSETKQAMSRIHKGKPKSAEHRKAMSDASLRMAALGLKSTMLGRKHKPESKAKISQIRLSKIKNGEIKAIYQPNRIDFIDRHNRTWVMRSSWEVKIAKKLDAAKLSWKYEPRFLILSDGRTYTPDFWVEELQSYIEVKGPFFGGLDKVEIARADGHPIMLIVNPDQWLTESVTKGHDA